MSREAPEFSLAGVDTNGRALIEGEIVTVLSVSSCLAELPPEDRERLLSLVGQQRRIELIDSYGFIWLSFDGTSGTEGDFCLFPEELALVGV